MLNRFGSSSIASSKQLLRLYNKRQLLNYTVNRQLLRRYSNNSNGSNGSRGLFNDRVLGVTALLVTIPAVIVIMNLSPFLFIPIGCLYLEATQYQRRRANWYRNNYRALFYTYSPHNYQVSDCWWRGCWLFRSRKSPQKRSLQSSNSSPKYFSLTMLRLLWYRMKACPPTNDPH